MERPSCEPVGAEIIGHAFTSERLISLGADDNLVLAKELLEFGSVVLPPSTIERLHHNFDHDDVITSV